MYAKVDKLFVFYCMLYFVTKPPILVDGQQVPCLYIFGDSLFDNGNNNFLVTLAKTNYLPYGIDYPDGPTGRFSNGKIVPDFIAEFLGFDEPIKPCSIANGADILKGVNYASGGGGILEETGRLQGDRFSMNGQLLNHGITISKITLSLGNVSVARELLNKCLYVVYIGGNEYVNNYLLAPLYLTSTFYTPQQFATIVIKRYSTQIRTLYNYGARKVVIYALGPIGCLPRYLITNPKNGSKECDDSINNMVELFNERLKSLIDALNADLDGAQFILINSTNIVQGDQFAVGMKVNDAPCCVVAKITGLCDALAVKEICRNRDEYYFWDNYHPSEFGNRAMAARSYDAKSPLDAYPFDIRRLLQK